MKKDILKKFAKPFFFILAVSIVLWEEIFYKPIKYFSNFIEKNKIVHKLSDKIRNSNPYVALAILAGCGLPLIPFKIAGIYLIGHGYTLLGMGTFGLAKVVGGAISVQIFNLTEPAIRKIKFMNTSFDWIFEKKNQIKQILIESSYYISLQNKIQQLKFQIKEACFNNTYFKKAHNFFSKKVGNTIELLVVPEQTIVERITSKIEHLNYSFTDKPLIATTLITEISVKNTN